MKSKFDFIQMIWFVDDNIFALPLDKIDEFCKKYKEKIDFLMDFAGHPKDINEDRLSRFIDAGLIRVHIGVQTGSKKTQKLYKRNFSNETILNAVHAIYKFRERIYPSYDVILDNPYETNEDRIETIKLLTKFPKPRRVSLFSFTFFPGTELYEKALKDGTLDKIGKGYDKDFLNFYDRQNIYLNYVFPLINKPIPNFVIKILINKYVVFLLDRPLICNILFKVKSFIKNLLQKKLKKSVIKHLQPVKLLQNKI